MGSLVLLVALLGPRTGALDPPVRPLIRAAFRLRSCVASSGAAIPCEKARGAVDAVDISSKAEGPGVSMRLMGSRASANTGRVFVAACFFFPGQERLERVRGLVVSDLEKLEAQMDNSLSCAGELVGTIPASGNLRDCHCDVCPPSQQQILHKEKGKERLEGGIRERKVPKSAEKCKMERRFFQWPSWSTR